ncbi:14414_t:CDS:1, partial [Cetraspora pellucida]
LDKSEEPEESKKPKEPENFEELKEINKLTVQIISQKRLHVNLQKRF